MNRDETARALAVAYLNSIEGHLNPEDHATKHFAAAIEKGERAGWHDPLYIAEPPFPSSRPGDEVMTQAVRVGGYMERLEFDYINYKGQKSHRRVIVHSINYGSSEWHTEPQWLMYALDLDKNEFRDFAMKDMTNVKDEP